MKVQHEAAADPPGAYINDASLAPPSQSPLPNFTPPPENEN
jgi:hypothetical protein